MPEQSAARFAALGIIFGFLLYWESALAQLDERQTAMLVNNCVQCHARPGIGVPMMGNPRDWAERNRQGTEKLLANVVLGLRGMPPLGYCSACSESDFRALIRLMTGVEETGK